MQEIYLGDCLEIMQGLKENSIDMIYLDPPFFTNKRHSLSSRDRKSHYSFNDIWDTHKIYSEFILVRLIEAKRILKDTGSIFIHCDKSANHILRLVGEEVFGEENFLSEIIWFYKRWSNSSNNLTPNHQNILFFSKTKEYKFNKIYTEYSETTNIDQILQKRSRDVHGKAIYARDVDGSIISSDEKKGVPLNDVWEIPFLNPKAKERTGYPTQKPILLLDRIIEISTNEGDIVLDPFCGSGTTLVAAKLKGRKFVGIDISKDAVNLTESRLETLVKTESALLNKGRLSYINADEKSLAILSGLDILPVHRNAGIDAILKRNYLSKPVPVRVQREYETLSEAVGKLLAAAKRKGAEIAFLVATNTAQDLFDFKADDCIVKIINSPALEINATIEQGLLNKSLNTDILPRTG
ncbi:MAG: site-specific DNA-methyltransferase [Methylobacter sp.]|jgi:site-specific DNA-methyltransferase (adenine-specific)|nr:site-specific DNA-methyltransferase [Methylobacter sp.]